MGRADQSREAVGMRIWEAGQALGLTTVRARATRCKMPWGSLKDIESGRRGPGLGQLQKICAGYGADANWLLGVSR